MPRLRLAQAPRSQVEHHFLVHLADGRAVRALDVVGEDLELRFGVDLGILGQEERLVRLLRIGLLRVRTHDNPAVEDGARMVADDAFVDFTAAAVGFRVIDSRMVVDEPRAVGEIEPVQRARTALAVENDVLIFTNAPTTETDRMTEHARIPRGADVQRANVKAVKAL